MPWRTHLSLRLGALLLLVVAGLWPRSPGPRAARTERPHQLVRTIAPHQLEGAARAVRAVRWEPPAPLPASTAAALATSPAAEVVADADDVTLTN